jgi:hypothetical protein
MRPELTPQTVRAAFKALEARGMIYYKPEGIYILERGEWKLFRELALALEEIVAWGHPTITATHPTTLEVTREAEIGKGADCVIGVRANKACVDLSEEFKELLKEGRKVEIVVRVEDLEDRIVAHGSSDLKLSHPRDTVVRKSKFVDERTLAILADKAAIDLDRRLVEKLKDPSTQIRILLRII